MNTEIAVGLGPYVWLRGRLGGQVGLSVRPKSPQQSEGS